MYIVKTNNHKTKYITKIKMREKKEKKINKIIKITFDFIKVLLNVEISIGRLLNTVEVLLLIHYYSFYLYSESVLFFLLYFFLALVVFLFVFVIFCEFFNLYVFFIDFDFSISFSYFKNNKTNYRTKKYVRNRNVTLAETSWNKDISIIFFYKYLIVL